MGGNEAIRGVLRGMERRGLEKGRKILFPATLHEKNLVAGWGWGWVGGGNPCMHSGSVCVRRDDREESTEKEK